VAVALITPGPVVITAVFIGYLVCGVLGGRDRWPGHLHADLPGRGDPRPLVHRHRGDLSIRAFTRGATAAAAGAIVGATIVLARQAIFDVPTALIAVLSLVYLSRLKSRLKEPALVLAAAAVGLAIRGV